MQFAPIPDRCGLRGRQSAAFPTVRGVGADLADFNGRGCPSPRCVRLSGSTPTARHSPHWSRRTGALAARHRSARDRCRWCSAPVGHRLIWQKAAGATVKGDVLVEFDRQAQLKNARDREAEYRDLLEQINRKRGEQASARAMRDTQLKQAANDLRIAELGVIGNDLVPRTTAEKNAQTLEEAKARLAQLGRTFESARRAEAADVRILDIQRDRAENAWKHARENADKMRITAPLDGLVVLKTIWKNGSMAEVQEGEEVRPRDADSGRGGPIRDARARRREPGRHRRARARPDRANHARLVSVANVSRTPRAALADRHDEHAVGPGAHVRGALLASTAPIRICCPISQRRSRSRLAPSTSPLVPHRDQEPRTHRRHAGRARERRLGGAAGTPEPLVCGRPPDGCRAEERVCRLPAGARRDPSGPLDDHDRALVWRGHADSGARDQRRDGVARRRGRSIRHDDAAADARAETLRVEADGIRDRQGGGGGCATRAGRGGGTVTGAIGR